MIRPYPHRPDLDTIRRLADEPAEEVAGVERTLGRGRGHLGIVTAGVDGCWEGVAYAWLFDETPEQALTLLPRGAGIVRIGLERFPGPLDAGSAEKWLAIPALLGDEELVATVADRLLQPDGVQEAPPARPQEVAAARLSAALRSGRDRIAEQHLEELRALGPRDVPPPAQVADEAFTRLAAAVLAGDQAGLDQAARDRSTARLTFGSRSQSNRASYSFLLDIAALSVMTAAARRGLTATPDLPDLPAELVNHHLTTT